MNTEFEVKFLGIDISKMRKALLQSDFQCTREEYMMVRKTFHKKNPQGEWFRVRQEQDTVTMTYKNIEKDAVDGIKEIEIIVNDFEKASEILLLAGLQNASLQENKREIWERNGLEICIDTWPGLQPYIEIEGTSEEEVRNVAKELGFDWSNGVFGGSESVYEIELGIAKSVLVKLPEITFRNPPK